MIGIIETTPVFQMEVLEFTVWTSTTLKLLLSALLVVSFWPKNVLSPTNSQQFFYSDLLQRLEHQLFRPWGDPWIIWDCQCSATGVADASLLLSFSTQLRDFKNKRIASKCTFWVLLRLQFCCLHYYYSITQNFSHERNWHNTC